jgi:CheY-like chemotaxis protein
MRNNEKSRLTALVVDDDLALREVLVEILDEAGFATTAFDRGLPALSAVGQDHFDLLLIDQWLPDINGIQICEVAHRQYGNASSVMLRP